MVTNEELMVEIKKSSINTRVIFIISMVIAFCALAVSINKQPESYILLAISVIYLITGVIWGVYHKYIRPPKA